MYLSFRLRYLRIIALPLILAAALSVPLCVALPIGSVSSAITSVAVQISVDLDANEESAAIGGPIIITVTCATLSEGGVSETQSRTLLFDRSDEDSLRFWDFALNQELKEFDSFCQSYLDELLQVTVTPSVAATETPADTATTATTTATPSTTGTIARQSPTVVGTLPLPGVTPSVWTPTPAVQPIASGTATPTVTVTATRTVTHASGTATPTVTVTATRTVTHTPSSSPTHTSTPANTPTNSPIPEPSATATAEPSAHSTPPPTPSEVFTAEVEETETPTHTPIDDPPSSTSSPTATATVTQTPETQPDEDPTGTATPGVDPSLTPAATPSPVPTATVTSTQSSTATPTASATPTATESATATSTPVETATATPASTATGTSTSTATPSATPTVTHTSTATRTPSATPSATPTPLTRPVLLAYWLTDSGLEAELRELDLEDLFPQMVVSYKSGGVSKTEYVSRGGKATIQAEVGTDVTATVKLQSISIQSDELATVQRQMLRGFAYCLPNMPAEAAHEAWDTDGINENRENDWEARSQYNVTHGSNGDAYTITCKFKVSKTDQGIAAAWLLREMDPITDEALPGEFSALAMGGWTRTESLVELETEDEPGVASGPSAGKPSGPASGAPAASPKIVKASAVAALNLADEQLWARVYDRAREFMANGLANGMRVYLYNADLEKTHPVKCEGFMRALNEAELFPPASERSPEDLPRLISEVGLAALMIHFGGTESSEELARGEVHVRRMIGYHKGGAQNTLIAGGKQFGFAFPRGDTIDSRVHIWRGFDNSNGVVHNSTFLICVSRNHSARLTWDNLIAVAGEYMELPRSLEQLKNPQRCESKLRDVFRTFPAIQNHEGWREMTKRFFYNLVFEHHGGDCSGANFQFWDGYLSGADGRLYVGRDVEGTVLSNLGDASSRSPIDLELWLKYRLLVHFLTVGVSELYGSNTWGPVDRTWRSIWDRLNATSTPSIEANNYRRGQLLDISKCKTLAAHGGLTGTAYLWCRYSLLGDFIPVVNLVQGGLVYGTDLATGKHVHSGEDVSLDSAVINGSMFAFMAIPGVGQAKGAFGLARTAASGFRARAWSGFELLSQKGAAAWRKGVRGIAAAGKQLAEEYRLLMNRAMNPTAARKLDDEATDASQAFGGFTRYLIDAVTEGAVAPVGPRFRIPSLPQLAAWTTSELPNVLRQGLRFHAGISLKQIETSVVIGNTRHFYEVIPDMKTFIGRLATRMAKNGWKLVFANVHDKTAGNSGILRWLIIQPVASVRISVARTVAEVRAVCELRHEVLHVALLKMLARGHFPALLTSIKNPFIHGVPFFQKGKGAYVSRLSMSELRTYIGDARNFMRGALNKNLTQTEREALEEVAAIRLAALGNFLHASSERMKALKAGARLTSHTKDSWDKLTKAEKAALSPENRKAIDEFLAQNPGALIVEAESVTTKGASILVPLMKYDGLGPVPAETVERAFGAYLAKSEGVLKKTTAKFDELAPKYSPTEPGTSFFVVTKNDDGHRIVARRPGAGRGAADESREKMHALIKELRPLLE